MTTADDSGDIKLADFGFAVSLSARASLNGATSGSSSGNNVVINVLTTQCGTLDYMAPEIIQATQPYGLAVDMWALGCVMYMLLGGYPPFFDEDDNEAVISGKIVKGDFDFNPDFWGIVSTEAKDLIKGLLTVDPAHRLTCDDALASAWVSYFH